MASRRLDGRWAAAASQLAFAAAVPVPIDSYQAPEACPDAAAFQAQVADRLDPRLSFGGRSLRVQIDAVGEGYRGRVELSDSATRELSTSDCNELVAALSLISAVLLQAEPETAPSAREAKASAAAPPTEKERAFAALSSRGAYSGAPPSSRWAALVGLGGAFELGSLPSLWWAPRARLAAEVTLGMHWAGEAGLSATLPHSEDRVVEEARATFQFIAGRIDACASRSLTPRFVLASCALFEVGRLEGTSVLGTARRVAWLGPGLQLRSEVVVARPFSSFLQVAARWPLSRGHFVFTRATQPAAEVVVYDMPAQAVAAEIGVLARFR